MTEKQIAVWKYLVAAAMNTDIRALTLTAPRREVICLVDAELFKRKNEKEKSAEKNR